MRNRSGEKIKLSGIDELLGVVNEESAMEIDIASIHPFAGHPFKVIDDDKMQDLVESVRENGVITPVLIRPAMENQYEMISGHRRMHAASLSEAQSSARRLTRTALPSAAPSSDCLRQTKRNLLRIPLFLPPSPMKSACSDLKMYRLEIG